MTTHVPGQTVPKVLLDDVALSRTLSRIAHELIERNADLEELALVGIHTRGVPIAERLRVAGRRALRCLRGHRSRGHHLPPRRCARPRRRPPLHAQPVVRGTELDFALEGKTVVLVDDVLYTGRTIRAAIDALLEYGRPARVQLAVLVDRGHRELPIRPDYVGKNVPTSSTERVSVELDEIDGQDRVLLAGRLR